MKPFCIFCLYLILIASCLGSSSGRLIESPDHYKSQNGGAGRCMAVMDADACNLSSCKKQCFQVKSGNGECLAKVQDGYQCVCYYNC